MYSNCTSLESSAVLLVLRCKYEAQAHCTSQCASVLIAKRSSSQLINIMTSINGAGTAGALYTSKNGVFHIRASEVLRGVLTDLVKKDTTNQAFKFYLCPMMAMSIQTGSDSPGPPMSFESNPQFMMMYFTCLLNFLESRKKLSKLKKVARLKPCSLFFRSSIVPEEWM